jgi:hypothetical protein
VDVRGKLWVCPFCFHRNPFPPNYADISETNLPAELIPKYTTIEYVLTRSQPSPPPAFLFLIDTCLPEEELQELKSSLLLVLTLIPENSLVGLITFGKTVIYACLSCVVNTTQCFVSQSSQHQLDIFSLLSVCCLCWDV